MTMPKILERLVSQLQAKGHDKSSSYAIATSALKKSGNLTSSGKATTKGKVRGEMTPGERAKDRQAKYSNKNPGDFKYNKRTNQATLKQPGYKKKR